MFPRTAHVAAGETMAQLSRSTRTWSSSSTGSGRVSVSSSTSSLSGISNGSAYEQQAVAPPSTTLPPAGNEELPPEPEEEEAVVGVAVGKEVKECKANLMWVLSNMDALTATSSNNCKKKKKATVMLLHVHRPAKTIPFMGAKFPAEQLHEEEVSAFRQAEAQAMHRAMARYKAICAKVKVQAICKVETVAGDGDGAQGILRLLAAPAQQGGITRLVIGAAADKRYSKKMTAPTSKTALSVQQQAHPLCHIWFLCKGALICTRPAAAVPVHVPVTIPARTANSSSSRHGDKASEIESHAGNALALATTYATTTRPRAAAAEPKDDGSQSVVSSSKGSSSKGYPAQQLGTFIQMRMSYNDEEEDADNAAAPPSAVPPWYQQVPAAAGDAGGTNSILTTPPLYYYYDDEDDKEKDIQSIFAEAEKLRREREKTPVAVKEQEHARYHQHQVVASLEAHLLSSKRVIQDLQDKLSEAHCMLFSMEREQDDLRRQRDAALREAAALRERVRRLEEEEEKDKDLSPPFIHLSYDDLQEATDNLDESRKLGLGLGMAGGGYGAVYRGVLRRGDGDKQEVAIKVLLNPQGQGQGQGQPPQGMHNFQQRVEELSRLRHPNVVPLLGACSAPEAMTWALVYQYLPGGSLEDRLLARSGTGMRRNEEEEAPLLLPWPDRTRIAAEVRSALVFLHQNSMVHGDLKPANVLLTSVHGGGGSNSKLADTGLWRLLEVEPDACAGAVLLPCMLSASTVPYMDPEFLASGELRPSSDAYAFGVILLRLLTGRPAMGLVKLVRAALAEGRLPDILDASAGEWPYAQQQAELLAHLGVSCCEMAGKDRPDLAGEMMTKALGCFEFQIQQSPPPVSRIAS